MASVEAFYSAIVHSHSLRQIECGTNSWYENGADDEDFYIWLWLACALFSPDASHDIHTVGLNMEILDDVRCVDAMRSILSCGDPLVRLDELVQGDGEDSHAVAYPAEAAVLIPSAAVYRGRYNGRSDGQNLVPFNPRVAYCAATIVTGVDVIEILIPHIGFCWCKSSDVLEMRPVTRRETHSVRHLRLIYLENDAVSPTIAFLQLVGGPLEVLTIEDLTLRVADSTRFFSTVLTHCPSLKRLVLKRCNPVSFQALCNQTTELESLYLDSVNATEQDNVDSLLAALGDPTQPLALSLRELHIDCGAYTSASECVLQSSAYKSCLAMLKRNLRLERCVLVSCPPTLPASWKSRFLKHDGEPLQSRLGPLPPTETLAFLSVTTPEYQATTRAKKPKAASKGGSARYKLDVDTLQLILELAALPRRRTCIMA